MDDVNQTNQVIALTDALKGEIRRVARWTIACFIFAVAVSVLVVVTKSVIFFVVALFAWFFAWNRWRLRHYLAAFLPPQQDKQGGWIESVVHGLQTPPPWYRFSEYIAAVTFIALFLLITIVVVATTGTGMRILFAACWLLLVTRLVVGVTSSRKKPKNGTPER